MKKIFLVAITLLGFSIFKANAQFVRAKPHLACPFQLYQHRKTFFFLSKLLYWHQNLTPKLKNHWLGLVLLKFFMRPSNP